MSLPDPIIEKTHSGQCNRCAGSLEDAMVLADVKI
jgi:hypothetical protein